jgi:hypothetical protein
MSVSSLEYVKFLLDIKQNIYSLAIFTTVYMTNNMLKTCSSKHTLHSQRRFISWLHENGNKRFCVFLQSKKEFFNEDVILVKNDYSIKVDASILIGASVLLHTLSQM